MTALAPCPSCRRHVRADANTCPFCRADIEPSAPSPLPTQRLSRAGLFVFAASIATGCPREDAAAHRDPATPVASADPQGTTSTSASTVASAVASTAPLVAPSASHTPSAMPSALGDPGSLTINGMKWTGDGGLAGMAGAYGGPPAPGLSGVGPVAGPVPEISVAAAKTTVPEADAILARNRWRFRACTAKALVMDPGVKGKIHLVVSVDAAGEVKDAKATAVGDPVPASLLACYAAATKSMKFPPVPSPATIEVDVTFRGKS